MSIIKNKKVLIFYVSQYSGHHQAALSIQKALYKNSSLQSECVDLVYCIYPKIGKMVRQAYYQLIKTIPQIWEALYDNPDIIDATNELRKIFNQLTLTKLKKILQSHNPQIAITTQAAPCQIVATYKEKLQSSLPLVAVITDFTVHGFWVSEYVDLYIVPTQEVKDELIKKNINENRIKVLGIPIDPIFSERLNKIKARNLLSLSPELFTILVCGGSQGILSIEDVLLSLNKVQFPIQVINICGHNNKLYKTIKKKQHKYKFPLKNISYTKRMSFLMDASDIIITKAGGLTLSESLVKGLAIVIVEPIPGQEWRNTQYLVKHNVAIKADCIKDIPFIITNLIKDSDKLEYMKRKSLSIAKPNASNDIIEAIIQIIQKNKYNSFDKTYLKESESEIYI